MLMPFYLIQSSVECPCSDITYSLENGLCSCRGCPTLVQALPGPSTQVTAGSNHTAVLLMDGQVFTFGSFSVSVTKNIPTVYFYCYCSVCDFKI